MSAFAETDDLQSPLLHLFSEYRCLLIKHKFTNRHHYSVGSPELFIEYYEGRRISSMRRPMFERHFEVEICAAVSFDRRCALFPFAWLDYTKAQFDNFIEDLLVIIEKAKMDRVDYLMRFITMLTLYMSEL